MSYIVILHLPNEDPVLGEMDELPKAGDTNVSVTNIRKRDGGRVAYLDGESERVIFPWHRITFIEIMPSEAEKAKLVKFYRE